MFNSIIKYYNTLKYLRPVQIYGRIFSIIKKKSNLIKLPNIPNKLKPSLIPKTNFIHHDPWNKKEELLKGNFDFLNYILKIGFPPKWKAEDTSLLWQFNLHYFNYLFLLDKDEQINLCNNWIENNKVGKGIGWHPYVISLRLICWCKIGFEDENINKSIYQQAAFLYRNLEYYHPANHYLENVRALIFAGLYFKDQGESDKWLEKGLKIYLTETPKQVLNDGGYFERSIMYHAIILESYLDILNILPNHNDNYNLFVDTAIKMLDFLIAATHPDGRISLFNDSTQEIAPSTKELIYYAKRLMVNDKLSEFEFNSKFKIQNLPAGRQGSKFHSNSVVYPIIQTSSQALNDSGYYVYRDDKFYLAIDGGAIGPDFIPAHAHADIFSYELSIKGVQFIVDSGVYEYSEGEMRSYVRSTKAHNTVSIDSRDQAECWGGFRVARRYKPYDVSFKDVDDKVFFEGKFGGYAKLIGDNLIHHRKIEIEKGTSTITVNDNITGSGNHNIESFIHLHPDVNIDRIDDNIMLSRNKVALQFKIQNSSFKIIDAWYCPEFGKKILNKVIKIYTNQLPSKLTYKFILK